MLLSELKKNHLYIDKTLNHFKLQFTGNVETRNDSGDISLLAEFKIYTEDQPRWFKEMYEGKTVNKLESFINDYIIEK